MRGIQMYVITCNNSLPALSGMDTTLTAGYQASNTNFYKEVCAGENVNFNIWGFDPDTFSVANTGNPERFAISWNNGIPAAGFTVYNNNSQNAYAYFHWQTLSQDISNTPKCFIVTIRDEACPYNGARTYKYCIKVKGIFVNIGTDTLLCKGESLQIIASNHQPGYTYTWYVDNIPLSGPSPSNTVTLNTANMLTGVHTVAVNVNPGVASICQGYDEFNVSVVNQPNVNLGPDTIICGNTYTLNAGPGNLYAWSTGQNTQLITVYPPGGTYTVYVDGGNYTRCNDADTVTVVIHPVSVPDIGNISGPLITPPYSEVYYSTTLNPQVPKSWSVTGGAILSSNTADSILVRWFPMGYGKVAIMSGSIVGCQSFDTTDVTIGYASLNVLESHDDGVFPNPVSDYITFQIPVSHNVYVLIYDIAGKLVTSINCSSPVCVADVRKFNPGVYFFTVIDKSNFIHSRGKFIVRK
jgi:hypothetical protein